VSPEDVKRDVANARERLAAIEVEVRALAQLAEGVKFAGEQTVRLAERFDALKDDLIDFKADLDGVSKGCREVVDAVSKMQGEQDNQRRVWSARERWLLMLAGVFGTGAVTLIVELILRP
jgi:uncharacterized protein YoxC